MTIAHADVTVAVEGDWDGDIRPLEALPVYLFSAAGKYLGIRQTTDDLGQVVFNLPAEDYKVRVDYLKQRHWSPVFNQLDQTVTIAEALAEVTVNGQGLPLTGVKVYAFNDTGAYLGLKDVTDSAGQVSFRLPAGDYDFRADYLGSRYFAGPTPLIAHVANPVVISTGGGNLVLTVQKLPQSPLAGVNCYLFSATGKYLAQRQVTGESGEAQFNLADGDYQIRVDYLGYRYWTDAFSIPSASELLFEIYHQDVTVTVSGDYDGDVKLLADVPVYLFNADEKYMKIKGKTDALGRAVFSLPEAEYQVRADYLKERYWSEVFAAADTEIIIDEGIADVAVSQAAQPLEGVKVYAFNAAGCYLGLSGTTDADGLIDFRLPQGTYKFRADHQGSRFWATFQVEGHVVNNVELATGVGTFVLNVQKNTGEALSGIPVYVFSDAGKYLGIKADTDETGQVTFDLADGTYRFRVDYLGYRFWTADLTLPDALSEVLIIDHQDVTVTVNEVYGYDTMPIEGIPVYLFTAGGPYQRMTAKTDDQGQVIFNLPEADYEVRADYLSGRFWSPVFNGTDVVVDIGHGLAAVHVTDAELDLFDVPVYLFNEAGKYLRRVERTDSAGMATYLVPEGTYKFRVDYDGNQLWSEPVSILADEQNDIEMDVEMLLSDLTTDPSPARFDGTPPVYEPQKMMVAGLGSLTGILPALITGQTSVDRIYFYINDHLGTPQVVVDEAGAVVWTADYEPFGAVDIGSDSNNANNFRFSGQYYDNETGLHYNYHRYYDPKTGRYLTSDPIGLLGGINLYTYTSNNPINREDLYGLADYIVNFNYEAFSWDAPGVVSVEGTVYTKEKNQNNRYEAAEFKGKFVGLSAGLNPVGKSASNILIFRDNWQDPDVTRIEGESRISQITFGFMEGFSIGSYKFGELHNKYLFSTTETSGILSATPLIKADIKVIGNVYETIYNYEDVCKE
ncbi:hypothetical protein D1AOALGA4SA_8213 [Olavius algarvensis Delta 1 endosymbiont]|nr:hypothetical protein D1AOALGA4SA_8213 [Olavius algarvensis Delta 1 endosymbiont]